MGYYARGDYYRRGDYYARGDLFGSIGKVLKAGASLVGGVVSGNPIGGIQGAVKAFQKPKTGLPQLPVLGPLGGAISTIGGALGFHGPDMAVDSRGRARRIRKDGKPYKRPSMNVTNPRALRRALRRAYGFEKVARKLITFTHGKAPHRGRFKKRARR